MKALCVLIVLSSFIQPAIAELKVPASAFRTGQFEEAAKQAAAQRKALSVVLSSESREASGTQSATDEAFKELASWTVTVFVESEGTEKPDTFMLPPPLATALVEGGAGLLPKVVISPPSADVAWTVIGAQKKQSGKEFRKEIRAKEPGVRVKVAAYFKDKTPPPPVLPGDQQLAWGRAQGGHFRGKFVKLEKEKLYLVDAKGTQSGGIDLKDLAPETQRYAKFIAGVPDGPKPESKPATPVPPSAPVAGAIENWQNKDGKIIRATFVTLKNDKLTLRMETGKEYTLPMENFALTSQARARELAQTGTGAR